MFPTSSTIPPTFEQYVDRFGIPEGTLAEHGDEIREMYDRERLAQQLHPAPADMPPCPPWCTFEPGHTYDSIDDLDVEAGMVTLVRAHSTEHIDRGSGGSLSQDESLRDGQVTLAEPVILTGPNLDSVTAAEARQRAAELLNLADRLDRITQ
jgi:hypothetical protein